MDWSRFREALRQGCVDPSFACLYHKDSPSAPPPPDPNKVASAQTGANVQSAVVQNSLNHPNVYTPLGSQTFTQTGTQHVGGQAPLSYQDWLHQTYPGGVPQPQPSGITGYDGQGNPIYGSGSVDPGQQYSSYLQAAQQNAGYDVPQMRQDITLSPAEQQLFNQQIQTQTGMAGLQGGVLGQAAHNLSQPFDAGGIKDVQNQAYGALTSRLDPQWQTRQTQEETQLTNQGLRPGDEAYTNAMRDFNNARNDAYQQANLAAIQTTPQTLQTQQALRDMPLNELSSLMTGSQVQMPQFSPGAPVNISPANIGQYTYGSYGGLQDIYNQQIATNNANTSAGAGMLGAVAIAL